MEDSSAGKHVSRDRTCDVVGDGKSSQRRATKPHHEAARLKIRSKKFSFSPTVCHAKLFAYPVYAVTMGESHNLSQRRRSLLPRAASRFSTRAVRPTNDAPCSDAYPVATSAEHHTPFTPKAFERNSSRGHVPACVRMNHNFGVSARGVYRSL